jgi:hypothetical protein
MKVLAIILAMLPLLAAAPSERLAEMKTPATNSVRFTTVDLRIDPRGEKLAAYQIEFTGDAQRIKLVGIEGGDHAAFKEPPYYDPAALSKNRVIVAAFNTGADLPSKSFRAARLHVQISGSERPQWGAKLKVASSADGKLIDAATVETVVEGAEQ